MTDPFDLSTPGRQLAEEFFKRWADHLAEWGQGTTLDEHIRYQELNEADKALLAGIAAGRSAADQVAVTASEEDSATFSINAQARAGDYLVAREFADQAREIIVADPWALDQNLLKAYAACAAYVEVMGVGTDTCGNVVAERVDRTSLNPQAIIGGSHWVSMGGEISAEANLADFRRRTFEEGIGALNRHTLPAGSRSSDQAKKVRAAFHAPAKAHAPPTIQARAQTRLQSPSGERERAD